MPKVKQTKDRLSKEEWLLHSLQTLANEGFTSLKADNLAKSLGVSRGSFYWHFKDLKDFHRQVLDMWKTIMVDGTIEQLEGVQPESGDTLAAKQKLEQLISIAGSSDPSLEQSIRAWAFSDSKVQDAVDEVNGLCTQYIEGLLQGMGFSEELAQVKARIIYAGHVGNIMLGGDISEAQQALLVEELLKLAE